MHTFKKFLVFVGLTLTAQLTWAHQSLQPCHQYLVGQKVITLQTTREMAVEHIGRNLLISPVPGFDNIEEQVKIVPVGELGPRAIQDVMGPGQSFLSTPAPTSKDPVSASLLQEAKNMFPVHLDLLWKGTQTSTTVYTAVPAHVGTTPGALIGHEFPVAFLHIHGGGTPTATGKNADKVAENLLKVGIPTIAPDMPGHGRGPRQIDPFLDAVSQLDYALEVADKMLHPNTKIIFSGHSWGGMFGLLLQRLSKINPKYKRIVHILSLAPGIDPSLGGTPAERNAFEKWYQENFQKFEARIAPGDFEFQKNVRANGKNSDVGAWFTGLFNLGYSLPVLTEADYAEMIPTTVVVGDSDGVVYVGFEDQFAKLFKPLGANFIVLGAGPTFRSTDKTVLYPTGHQMFERELMPNEDGYVAGKNTIQAYRIINNMALGSIGRAYNFQPPSSISSPAQIIDSVVRKYANFFAFRSMLASTVEYVDVDTADTNTLAASKKTLDGYLSRVAERRRTAIIASDAVAAQPLAALRARLGIVEKMTYEGSLTELSFPPLTDARKAELEAYVAAVLKIEEDMPSLFKDPVTDGQLAAIRTKYADVLAKLGVDLDGLKAKLEVMIAEDKDFKAKRQAEKDAVIARGGTWKLSADADKAQKQIEKFRGQVGVAYQEYQAVWKVRMKAFNEAKEKLIAALKKPSGVENMKDARRQATLARSAERTAALQAYVAEFKKAEEEGKRLAEASIIAAVNEIRKPDGVTSEEDALAQVAEVDARNELYFVPANQPHIAPLAAKVLEMTKKVESLTGADPSKNVLSIKDATAALGVEQDKLKAMADQAEAGWPGRLAKSPELQALQAEYDRTLADFDLHEPKYEHAKSAFLDELNRTGRVSEANIIAGTPELLALRAKAQAVRATFLAAKAKLDAAKVPEYLAKVQAAFKAKEAALEARRREIYKAEQEKDEARMAYAAAMVAAGEKVKVTVARYELYSLWNRPLSEVRKQLETDRFFRQAMIDFLARWDGFESELNRIHGASTDNLN